MSSQMDYYIRRRITKIATEVAGKKIDDVRSRSTQDSAVDVRGARQHCRTDKRRTPEQLNAMFANAFKVAASQK